MLLLKLAARLIDLMVHHVNNNSPTVYVIATATTPTSEENIPKRSLCILSHPIITGKIITAGKNLFEIISLVSLETNTLTSQVSGLIIKTAADILPKAILLSRPIVISLN
jgi:hypothetical protein